MRHQRTLPTTAPPPGDETAPPQSGAAAPPSFPVGYRAFHADPAINYELNRWLGPLPEDELATAAPRIGSLADWSAVMLEQAERAENGDRVLAAAFYHRAAEFFLEFGDPAKERAYRRFRELHQRAVAAVPHTRHRVPFESAWLPAIELPAAGGAARGALLLHGGFDSLQEELFDWGRVFAHAGYRVVLFEGPGQGAALRDHGLTMRPDWERPVAAVLDHLEIERAALLGVSLGGCLAPRAAAFEPRVEQVIAYDVLDDFFDCFASRAGEEAAALLLGLADRGARDEVNAIVERTTAASPWTAWAIRHGLHVAGAADAYELVCWLREMRTAPVAHLVTQDVLLLGGAEDHIVPLRQLWRQAASLPAARSVTVRLFSAREQAQSHCQIGNVGLALGVVRHWLDFHCGESVSAPQ